MSILDLYKKSRTISIEELGRASDDELLTLKNLVDDDIFRIGTQLNNAKSQVITTGTYSDPIWYRKAEAAKKFRGGLSQKIQTEMGKRRDERKIINREIHTKDIMFTMMQAMNLILTTDQAEKVLAKFRELREER